MALTANSDGNASGRFTIPSGIPAGTVEVAIEGDQGSRGTTTYTASGEIETQQRRVVTTVTQWYDPLAQTFALIEGRHIGGVDLWFKKAGTSRVQVQIRETTVGFPNQNVIAHATLKPDQIKIDGTPTRVTFRPIWLEANTEYAIVILTDDAETEVAVAEVGQYDSVHQTYVTKQAYQTGVLLSSSNASTWTSHQTMDLTFRLLACKFTEKQLEVDFGQITAAKNTDILIMADVERASNETDVEFILTDKNGKQNIISEDMSVQLQEELDGEVSFKARLKGNETKSPVLYQGVQLLLGTQRTTGDYVTRAIPAGTNSMVKVTYECYTPGTSSVKVYYQQPNLEWALITLDSGSNIGDGVEERTHILNSYNQDTVKIKIVLEGNVMYRPYVKNLRVITI